MKKVNKLFVIFFIVILFSGCNDSNVKSINVLNWSSYIPDEVISDFEKESGIKVNYGTYSSNEELLAKISSSKIGTYDLIFPSDYMVELMKEKDYLQDLDLSKLENLSNIKDEYLGLEYDKNNLYSIPFLAASVVMIKNSNNISEELNSYNDLLNPKYENNIVVLDDQRIMIGAALLALGYDLNETDKSKLSEAENWLLQLKTNIKAFDSDSPKMYLISKEADIGLIWNAEAAIAMNENAYFKVTYPKEGTILSIDNFTILKGCNNVDEVYTFIDYILRPEVMTRILDGYPYKNLNKKSDLMLSSEYLSNNASNFPDNLIENSFFIKNIGEDIKLYDKVWANIK